MSILSQEVFLPCTLLVALARIAPQLPEKCPAQHCQPRPFFLLCAWTTNLGRHGMNKTCVRAGNSWDKRLPVPLLHRILDSSR
ncbi:hypothetical protein J3E68DRAFT_396364 [Trichoderma sp. SZMC 28012]